MHINTPHRPRPAKLLSVLGLAGAALLLAPALMPVNPAQAKPSDEARPTGHAAERVRIADLPTRGLWVWREQWVATEAQQDRLLAFATAHGMDLLMVQVHLKPGRDDDGTRHLKYPDELARLIAEARTRGIDVEALDGAPGMGLADRRADALAVIDAMIKFNNTLPTDDRLKGIHLDVEPYILDDWKQGGDTRQAIMRETLGFFEAVAERCHAQQPRLRFAADIPFWYDHKTEDRGPEDTCMVDFHGTRKNFAQHIQDLTDYIGIMSYRRFALGRNSITYHCTGEAAYAASIGKSVMAAVETGQATANTQEAHIISFWGMPTDEFWAEIGKAEGFIDQTPGMHGILFHSYKRMRAYLEE